MWLKIKMNSLKQIHEILCKQTKGAQVHWLVRRKTGYLLRLTNNYIHQSGYQDQISVALRLARGGRVGLAETSDTSRGGLDFLIQTAQKATEFAEPGDIIFRPQVTRGRFPTVHDYFPAALEFSP